MVITLLLILFLRLRVHRARNKKYYDVYLRPRIGTRPNPGLRPTSTGHRHVNADGVLPQAGRGDG